MQFVCLLSFHFLTSSSFLHSAYCTCCRRRCIAPHTTSSHWLPLLASLRAACATWRCNTVHACVLFMCIVWHPVSILYWAILCFMAPQCTQSPLSSTRSTPNRAAAACWECSASASAGSSSNWLKTLDYPIETNQLSNWASAGNSQGWPTPSERPLYSKYIYSRSNSLMSCISCWRRSHSVTELSWVGGNLTGLIAQLPFGKISQLCGKLLGISLV